MKLALSLFVFLATTTAAASPPPVILLDVDRDQLDGIVWSQLPPSEVEPGGLVVPANADASWFTVGLKPGDILRYLDGEAAVGLILLRDGVNLLEIERNRKPLLLRVTIHGPALATARLRETEFEELAKQLASVSDPHTTVVRRKDVPSGVRVVTSLLRFSIDLRVGDIVRRVDGVPVVSEAAFVAALRQLRVGHTDLQIERSGRPVTIQVERDAPIDLSTVTRISATRFDIPKSVVKSLGEDPELVTRKVKSMPVVRAGAVRGLRLYGVEHGSVCAAMGLQNDDVLLDIEGRSIGSLTTFEAHELIDGAKQFTIHIERKRKRVAITYVVR
jgi:hypothetical protein